MNTKNSKNFLYFMSVIVALFSIGCFAEQQPQIKSTVSAPPALIKQRWVSPAQRAIHVDFDDVEGPLVMTKFFRGSIVKAFRPAYVQLMREYVSTLEIERRLGVHIDMNGCKSNAAKSIRATYIASLKSQLNILKGILESMSDHVLRHGQNPITRFEAEEICQHEPCGSLIQKVEEREIYFEQLKEMLARNVPGRDYYKRNLVDAIKHFNEMSCE